MEDKELFLIFMLLPALAMVGGFGVFITALIRRGKIAEFRHRERMAMIERGMPPPSDRVEFHERRTSSTRMTLGIVIVGFGLSLLMLISFAAGEPGVGIGVGGAIATLGAAFIVSGLVVKPSDTGTEPLRMRTEPPPPPSPPVA